ncbi:MAG: hypothetical protein WD960_13495 [Gemmatimonadota bacterium]
MSAPPCPCPPPSTPWPRRSASSCAGGPRPSSASPSRATTGTHLNAIGSFKPEMQEIDAETVRRSRLVVDEREAALEKAGDLIIPLNDGVIGPDHIVAEIGELVEGRVEGLTSAEEVTFFKSVVVADQDVAVAARVLERAEAEGMGMEVEL